MDFDEFLMDAKLHIQTTGRDETCSDENISPYEPTTYTVLERLAAGGYVTASDHLVDYGCGLGRVVIYFIDRIGCKASGVEVVRKFYEKAKQNYEAYVGFLAEQGKALGGAGDFYYAKAQDFELPHTANRLFFFNPFHLNTFKKVMTQVIASYHKHPRGIQMFFYYPQDSYVAYLSTLPEVMFYDEVDCTDLFDEEDPRNRIMIFELEEMEGEDGGDISDQ